MGNPLSHIPGLGFLAVAFASLAGCTINATEGHDDDWDSRGGSAGRASDMRDSGAGPMRVTVSEGSFPRVEGQEIVVHLRRDVLGMHGATAAGINLDGPNRDSFSVTGTYRGQDGNWVRLEQADGRTLYLPLSAILAVETRAVAPAGTANP